ncbi:TPA: hypothetical protein HA242_04820 [Candidatus Woesearchaeota archaeon]|nr:hypothetical protein [Candidatus Woesearchaeota archaeon]HIG93682.1 hypothetical protein [Candidatus Woesearchaeota archaeon]HIH13022.1 hypothetical protein [Candidatus Woesearchaeota archaeon]
MNKMQLLGILGALLLIANIVLFAFKLISWILFWAIIIAAALFTYKILPKMKKD